MFKRLRKLFGIKAKAKSGSSSKSQTLVPPAPQVQPLPFNLSLEKMQEDALNTISNILKHRTAELEVLISASRLRVMIYKTSDFQTKHLARIFPALFADSEMNCINLHAHVGDGVHAESYGFIWGFSKEYIKIDFCFTTDSLSEEDATEMLSHIAEGLDENNDPAESSADADTECVGLGDTLHIEARTYRPFLPRTAMPVAEAVKKVTGFIFGGKKVRARLGISDAADEVLSFAGCPIEQATIDKDKRVTFSGGHQNQKETNPNVTKSSNPKVDRDDVSTWYAPEARL